MPDFEIIPAKWWHTLYIAKHMRQADVAELEAWTGSTPAKAMRSGYLGSTASWTAMVDSRPAAMFGVYPQSVLTRVGTPWLLGTDDTRKVRRKFLTESKYVVRTMLTLYPTLINYVDKRNGQSIQWLRWLGFDFKYEVPGKNGLPFFRFEMRV